jgi:hypothetical protein
LKYRSSTLILAGFSGTLIFDYGLIEQIEFGKLCIYTKKLIVEFPRQGPEGKDFCQMQSFQCALTGIRPYTTSGKELAYSSKALEVFKEIMRPRNHKLLVFANIYLVVYNWKARVVLQTRDCLYGDTYVQQFLTSRNQLLWCQEPLVSQENKKYFGRDGMSEDNKSTDFNQKFIFHI